jgi:hypothetical protein
MTTETDPKPPVMDHVHTWFGLSYSNYAVLPRTLLQSMPDEWQARFVELMDEFADAFAHVPQADGYQITAGIWQYVEDCTDQQLTLAGVTQGEEDPDFFYSKTGEELTYTSWVFVPGADPVPHYNRGRTYIPPRLDETEETTR